MLHLFESEVYHDRRNLLAGNFRDEIILFPGNEHSPINYAANYYPFRQDSNFLYYCGIDLPGLDLVIDCRNGETILYGDDPTIEDTVWTGPQPELGALAAKVGIIDVRARKDIINDFGDCDVLCLPPYRDEHFRLLQNLTLHADCSVTPSEQLIHAVISQREIKEDREIEQMEEALIITAQMHRKVMRAAKPGMHESVLAGIVQGIAAANMGHMAYGIILSKNGHILHNHSYDNELIGGDIVLGDFGAENRMRYASDITRTFPIDPEFSDQQRDVYEIVLESQIKAINAVRPGQTFRDVHLLASRIIADGLVALDLMKGDPEEIVAAGAHALFFPHGLGHMIGLDVHDMEGLGEDHVGYDQATARSDQFGLSALRMGKTLKPGHVVTVEPGVYFIPALIELWKKDQKHEDFIRYDNLDDYLDFGGIRIEDNILVTETGQRVMGPQIPKSVDQVEELRYASRKG